MMVELLQSKGSLGAIQNWIGNRSRRPLGAWGEWIALRYLLKRGYDIIARNWRIRHGEVDLIAYDSDDLVFIEVKTRLGPSLLPPECNVGAEKEQKLEFLAYAFLNRHELIDIPLRFDLIAIETEDRREYEIRHYKGFM